MCCRNQAACPIISYPGSSITKSCPEHIHSSVMLTLADRQILRQAQPCHGGVHDTENHKVPMHRIGKDFIHSGKTEGEVPWSNHGNFGVFCNAGMFRFHRSCKTKESFRAYGVAVCLPQVNQKVHRWSTVTSGLA